MTTLPPVLSVSDISLRLQVIFPEGTPNRNYVIRDMSVKTVFVMLYVGAIEGNSRWIRPDQVIRMTDPQATMTEDSARETWLVESMRPAAGNIEGRWYSTNTREPIRDETLRGGLVLTGAVLERAGVTTTSPLPRYALSESFAALFDPTLTNEELEEAIVVWREANLSAPALARIAILRSGVIADETQVLVTLPNGQTRSMASGPSSVISKAVVEEFAPRFLERPGLLWLSESRNKVVEQDSQLAQAIGLAIDPNRNLPDLILVDLGPADPLLVFVEVVATNGPVSAARRSALLQIATGAGFSEAQATFVTAYADRNDAAFRRSVSELAWGTFAWFMSEPDHVVLWYAGRESSEQGKLSAMIGL